MVKLTTGITEFRGKCKRCKCEFIYGRDEVKHKKVVCPSCGKKVKFRWKDGVAESSTVIYGDIISKQDINFLPSTEYVDGTKKIKRIIRITHTQIHTKSPETTKLVVDKNNITRHIFDEATKQRIIAEYNACVNKDDLKALAAKYDLSSVKNVDQNVKRWTGVWKH